MSKWKRRVIWTGIGILSSSVGGAAAIVVVAAMSFCLLKNPLDADGAGNWAFWIACISAGLGLLARGFYASHKWKLTQDTEKPIKTEIAQMSVVGAMLGGGVGILYWEISQIGVAFVIQWIQSR